MVEKKFDKTMVRLIKNAYGLKTKLNGYLTGDNVDRSNMKIYILQDTRIMFSAEISNYANGERVFHVELDGISLVEIDDISLDKLYEVINDFTKLSNATNILINNTYTIFAYSFGKDNYIPVNMDKFKRLEISVMSVAPIVDELLKDKDNYMIYVMDDLVKIADCYTLHSLIFILIKFYVEYRFLGVEKEKLKDKRIISFQGFSLLFFHIKSLLHAKEIYKETLKSGYETMSKMNLLPYVPSEIWYIEESCKNLKLERLKEFKKKKHNIFERIVKNKSITIPSPKTAYIPTYLAHLFDENSPIIGWKEFCENVRDMDWGIESFSPAVWVSKTEENIFCIVPCIIVPDSNIVDITPNNISFMGYDGDDLTIVIKSKNHSAKQTEEETSIRERIGRHILIKLGLTANIVFDTLDISDTNQLRLLESGE